MVSRLRKRARPRIVGPDGREPRLLGAVTFVLLLAVAGNLITLVIGAASGAFGLLTDLGAAAQIAVSISVTVFTGWVAMRLLDSNPVALVPARLIVGLLLLGSVQMVFTAEDGAGARVYPALLTGLYAVLLVALFRMRARTPT